jgi:hypothetical protein
MRVSCVWTEATHGWDDMLASIPIIAFLGLFLALLRYFPADWRLAFLRAAIAWGVTMVLITELLSLFHLVTVAGLAIAWLVPCLVIGGWLTWGRGSLGNRSPESGGRQMIIRQRLVRLMPPTWSDRLLLLGLIVILCITAIVAWFSPPQTWDSLNYHMARVAHWAQERAVVDYATGIEVQNVIPPGSEMIMLQFYVLQQGDRMVTFVGWFAMLTSLVAVSRIARSLGASLRGQLLAAVFLGTLPMGIIQASSTVSDYVMALWVLCAAVESVDVFVVGIRSDRLFFVSLTAGMAILTKPTAVAYLTPLAIFLAVILLRRLRLGRSLLWGFVAVILVVALNIGPLIRNTRFYGNPLGSPSQLGTHRNQLANLQGTTSNIIRNFSMHLGTPLRYVNKGLGVVVQQLHRWLGVDINDRRTTSLGVFRIHGITTGEDIAGNPMQAYFILLAIPVMILGRKRLSKATLVYALVALSSIVVFSWLFKWQSFSGRYHIAFFALFAPVAGCLLAAFAPKHWAAAVGGLFLVTAWPWLFSIQSRPLIPVVGDSLTKSILVEPRQNLYFANAQYLVNNYTLLVGTIEETDCNQIGIAMGGISPEYLLWVLLDAPRPDLRVEWLVSGGPSGLTLSPDFTPCAVICEKCAANVQEFKGLPLVYTRDVYQLFMLAPVP